MSEFSFEWEFDSETKIKDLKKELELRHVWVKHYQATSEIDSLKVNKLMKRIEELEERFIVKR